MTDEELDQCVNCKHAQAEHSQPAAESAYLQKCPIGGGLYWSQWRRRQDDCNERSKFLREALLASVRGTELTATVLGKLWDGLREEERRYFGAWRPTE